MNEPAICMSILGPSSGYEQSPGNVNWSSGGSKMIAHIPFYILSEQEGILFSLQKIYKGIHLFLLEFQKLVMLSDRFEMYVEAIIKIVKLEAGVITKDSMRFDGVGLKMNHYKETTEREGHRAIDVVGGEDRDVDNKPTSAIERVEQVEEWGFTYMFDSDDEPTSAIEKLLGFWYEEENRRIAEVANHGLVFFHREEFATKEGDLQSVEGNIEGCDFV
ncbi:hypothetical protein GIB67_021084 [Kingdonia uniflora]|uniref:Uncharacterized protein n=1 Tax=Kingdonia uniflora TaxID=39325 RepID=A0A7J7N714_9MAGN|nr:hypothetical protein GIB67_021084 [Kingdonia uniflora]